MKRFLSTVVLALASAAFAIPAWADNQSLGATYKAVGDGMFTKDLTSADAAGVYVIGSAINKGLLDFDRGSAFVGTFYGCVLQNADADNSGAVDAAAGCEALATLNADIESTPFTTGKRYFVLDIDTAESGSNVSRLTIRGSNVAGASGGAPLVEYAALPSLDETSISHVTVTDCDDLTCASPGTGSTNVPFYYNGSAWVPFPGAAAGIANVSEDLTPTLGGDLDGGDFDVTNLNSIGERNFYADSLTELAEAETACGQDMGGASPTGCHIWVTAPSLTTTATLEWFGTGGEATGNNSIHIHGMGGSLTGNNINDAGTVIHWNNVTGAPMVQVGACVGCSIDGFLFDGNGQATAGIKAANDAGPIVGLEVHHNGFYNIAGKGIETMDGGTTAGQGQWDTSWFHNNTFRHTQGCYKSNNSQSLGMVWGPDNTCTWQDGTGPFIDVAYGELLYINNYLGINTDNAIGMRLGAGANHLLVQQFNQFEINSHSGDGITAANASVDGVKVIECEATAAGQAGKLIVDGAQFVSNTGTNKAVSCEKRGTVQLTNLNWSNTGANDNSAALTLEVTRDDGFATNMLDLVEFGNFFTMGHADYTGRDFPEPWTIAYTNDPHIRRPNVVRATAPNTCRVGDLWIDSDNGNLSTCYPANTWITPYGDISTIGDCTTGSCFEGAGSESTIKAIGNVLIDLDDDNNTANSHFYVRTGTNAAVLDVDELGNALSLTSFYSPSIQGSTDVHVGEDTSTTGTLHFYHSDGGAQTFVMPSGSAALAYTLPADDGAAGEQLTSDGAGGLTWENPAGVASGDSAAFFGNDVTNTAGFAFDVGAGLTGTFTANVSPTPSDAGVELDLTIAYGTMTNQSEFCYLTTSGTGSGGFVCEGATANTTEHYFTFPTLNSSGSAIDSGSDTERFIVLENTQQTLTGKTIDAEATGNVLTTVEKVWFPAAGCNNATPTPFYDLPTSSAAEAGCITGTNTQKGVLDFDQTTSESAQVTHLLPADWTGTVDVKLKWLTTYTSSSVAWDVATACVADAETDDPAFNTASEVVDATKGTTNQTNDATITGLTVTGCAAGELLHLKVSRNPAHASDATLADARLIGFELTYRRAI